MELKLNSGDTITIPDDCKAVIKDKIITVEKAVQDFKDGDFVSLSNLSGKFLIIYKNKRGLSNAYYHVATYNCYCESCVVYYNDWCFYGEVRIATEEEKQLLLDALHADGNDWDAEKKQIVDYKWKPKFGEKYFSFDSYMRPACFIWQHTQNDEHCYLTNKCFKTLEESEKYAKKIAEILKNRDL